MSRGDGELRLPEVFNEESAVLGVSDGVERGSG